MELVFTHYTNFFLSTYIIFPSVPVKTDKQQQCAVHQSIRVDTRISLIHGIVWAPAPNPAAIFSLCPPIQYSSFRSANAVQEIGKSHRRVANIVTTTDYRESSYGVRFWRTGDRRQLAEFSAFRRLFT